MGQILWVGKSYTLPEAGVKRHSHPYYHMFHIVSGTGHFDVEAESFELTEGQSLLIPPNTEHAYSNLSDETMNYYELKFSLPQSGKDSLLLEGICRTDAPILGLLLEQILEEYASLGNMADDAAVAYLQAVLNVLTFPQRAARPRQFQYFDASGATELSQKIVRYLEKHYSQELSLDELADAMDYNKSYLCVAFKKNVGLTILDCLNTIRIRRAAELIVYSDHPLAQVAERCGFASVSHFNRVFLKYVGITPGQCRRAYPVDAIFKAPKEIAGETDHPNPIMYSVLAQKRITAEMIQQLGSFDEDK